MSTVLAVDDSKVVRSMVTRHLQPYGCTIVEATNGQEGVEMARAHKPDLVLLDVTMPVMDGRQALGELRKDDATKGIPVIMLTAESGRDLVVEIAKLGVNGYIVKPFQQETFEKEVSKVLGAPAGAAAPAAVDPRTVLIVDVAQLNDLTSEHVAGLVRLLSEAGTLGIRTAICAPDAFVNKLRQIAETKDAPYASTRDGARQCLQ